MKFKTALNISLQYHQTLNDKVWDLGSDNAEPMMKPEIRDALLKIARAWQTYCDIPSFAVRDIIFTGGNANYNYTNQSDMDVHLVIEPKLISTDEKLVLASMFDKKALWANAHPDIRVKGYPVELFAQPITEKPHEDQGVYSLVLNMWIQAPKKKNIDFSSDPHLMKKANWFKHRINDIVDGKSKDEFAIVTLKERIRNMRNSAIQKGGEFSFENLVFKELRNSGYLDKLSRYKTRLEDEQLSLESIGKHRDVPDSHFDPKELIMGIEVEKEHTDNAEDAKAVAKDHLMELPDYYSRLKKMEKGASKNGKG